MSSLLTKLKNMNKASLAITLFYKITAILLLVMLPLSGYPPHIALIAIVSFITAYSLFTKRPWTIWLVIILFVVITTFAAVTAFYAITTDALAATAIIAYAALTWVFTVYTFSKRNLILT